VATLDQLPPEQRAILELVVQRNRSYEDLAVMLDLPPLRVRELAREALVGLAPVTANRVDADRLGQIADYVLDQQSSAEQTATKAHLRRSEAGRAWTSSLLDSLAHMYDGSPPEIPEAEEAPPPRRRRERAPRERERVRERPRVERPRVREPLRRREPEVEAAPRPALSPEALSAVRRRRMGAALIGIAAIVGIVIGIVAITGGGSKKSSKRTAVPAQTRIIGELLLRPVNGANKNNQGVAIVAQRGSERDLIVQAKLPPTKQGQAYEVWLYNSKTDAVPVGAQVTDQSGNYQGAGKLPADLSKFQAIDVSLQQIPDQACQKNPACLKRVSAHSGNSVLRGLVADMRAPGQTGTGTGGAGAAPGGATPGGQPTAPGAAPGGAATGP
jgi:anti-sigma-K factor RskA/sigma-70-like protein